MPKKESEMEIPIMKKLLLIILLLFAGTAHSAEVTIQWTPVAEADGYKVYYGSSSGTYQTPIDANSQTTHTLTLDSGVYFFAVTAYNNYGESGRSEEVACAILEKPVVITVSFSP